MRNLLVFAALLSLACSPTPSVEDNAARPAPALTPQAGQRNDCPKCLETATACDILDLNCAPLGVNKGDCAAVHDMCVGGASEADMCEVMAKIAGKPGAEVCACAYACPAP